MIFKRRSFQSIRELVKDKAGFGINKTFDNDSHLQAAAEWILRAQEATEDKGVSRMYSLLKGWGPSYPETTGYIIPTLIEYGKKTNNDKFSKRALEMADWEIEIQLESGAVMAGTIDANPVAPTIFNTGQNLFGWIDAYKESNDERYLNAAVKAVKWMKEAQDEEGCWAKFHSPFAKFKVNTYNIRSAWGMCKVFNVTQERELLSAVEKNMNWVLTQQNENGWFDNNCLNDNKNPLTHTIGYTIEGILGIGLALNEPSYILAAQKTAEELLKVQQHDGSLPGRFNEKWKPVESWICLTGLAQIAICWWLLYDYTGNDNFKKGAAKANAFLKSTQDLENRNPGIRGGIKGSFPVNGGYGKYQYLNWAAKFFMDSLMLEDKHIENDY
ncbi:hypothetical protein DSCA_12140 [Desulfosarcina alkanivorans]|uniref:Squalene cyclase C-terminal domain-containing protein n=1 Tax=Desulfosarcina alkanivorans TaxID=571177 RepID=A0A5K7YLS1_9BACT|nr:hypothetical protein [Desulfosarcina alkanivorans]BBO67284.1 hypothetical protein DSCA_12140 [Desulfosarcina alkanivorans]